MLASVITARAGKLLQDTGATRWTAASLLDYLNEGRRKIVAAVPERFRTRRVVTLSAGASQSAPSDCAHFFGVVRNMGADGATDGAVVREVDRAALIAFSANWMGTTGSTVKEYAIENPRQRTYLINPSIPSTPVVQVEIELAAYPTALTATSEDIVLADEYEVPLLAWVMHRALIEETEQSAPEKAAAYLNQYKMELGIA
jgi:hypothetical protein